MKPENRIYYAEQSGNFYLRFVGDVRVTFCATLNTYLDRLFEAPQINSVVVDLRKAKGVDSTTLGLLAKLALYVQHRSNLKPLMILEDASLLRLIESMGLDEIFSLTDDFSEDSAKLKELPLTAVDSEEAREQVIAAHRTLMELNSKNMLVFSDLVKSLESERKKIS
jgi:anti-anti-sigma factor